MRLAPADLLSLGTIGIRTRRMRAVLSALGIAVGIATMVAVTSIPESSERALMNELAALGPNLLQVTPAPDRDAGRPSLPAGSVAMVARIAPVTSVSAVANLNTVARRSDLTDPRDGSGLTVLASRPDLLDTLEARVLSGRFLDRGGFPTVVLGSVAAARLGIPAVRGRRTAAPRRGLLVQRRSASSRPPHCRRRSTARCSSTGTRPARSSGSTAARPCCICGRGSPPSSRSARCCPRPSIRRRRARCWSRCRPTRWPPSAPPSGPSPCSSSAWPWWPCWSAASAWPTPWSSRCWSGARRSACAGPWAPPGATSASSS